MGRTGVERAFGERLHQLNSSAALRVPAKVATRIRKRCGGNPKRYEEAHGRLAMHRRRCG